MDPSTDGIADLEPAPKPSRWTIIAVSITGCISFILFIILFSLFIFFAWLFGGPLQPYTNFLTNYNTRIINYSFRRGAFANSTVSVEFDRKRVSLDKIMMSRSYGRGWPSYDYVEFRYDRLPSDTPNGHNNFQLFMKTGADPERLVSNLTVPGFRGSGPYPNVLSSLCVVFEPNDQKMYSPTEYSQNFPGDSTHYLHHSECPTLFDPQFQQRNMTFVVRLANDPYALGEAIQWSLEDLGYGAYILAAIGLSISIVLSLCAFCGVALSIGYCVIRIVYATKG